MGKLVKKHRVSVQSMIKNEMELIPRYYKWIREFADEWVILDSLSTDGTLEFLEDVKKYDKTMDLIVKSSTDYDLKHCKDFNYLLEESRKLCTGNWIWLGYVDEFCPLLTRSIPRLVDKPMGYRFNRFNIVSYRPLTNWKTEKVLRFYNNESKITKWVGAKIHSESLKTPFRRMDILNVPIYHFGPARALEKIRSKEEGFEACGTSDLGSKFSEDRREKMKTHPIGETEIADMFCVTPRVQLLNPHRVLNFPEKLDCIKHKIIPDPVMVEIFPSGVCNHKCEYCLFKECRDSKFLDTKYISKVLSEIEGKVKGVEFCGGGEPTLHPEFTKILREGYIRGFELGLITNGSKLKTIYEDVARYCRYVRISLDADTRDLHEKIHGTTDFDYIVDGIRHLYDEKYRYNYPIQISLKFTMSELNFDHINRMMRLGQDLDIDTIQFKAVRDSPNTLPASKLAYLDRELSRLKDRTNRITGSFKKPTLNSTCIANILSTFINENGDMFICCYYNGRVDKHKLGNIKDQKFYDIWGSKAHKEKLDLINIKECNRFDCRFMAYNEIIFDYITSGGVSFV